MVAATGISAELSSRTVAGVRVFDLRHEQVRRAPGTRGWAPALASTHLDAVALAYEEQLEWLLDLCAVELSVRRLAGEIARTTKQVNGLENIVLPRLHEEARRIALTLDEREREEHARLRRARSRRTARDASRDRHDGTRRVA
jgi:V/A-type H+-transporting ATPase subunit D